MFPKKERLTSLLEDIFKETDIPALRKVTETMLSDAKSN